MTLLRHTTLRRRLILITLITAAIALLLAGAVTFVAELTSFKDAIVRDISIKADIIGNQCTAALVFNVQRDAEETLGTLRADTHIEYAAVYTKNGALFAEYQQENKAGQSPQAPPPAVGYRFGIDHLDLMHPIVLHGERIGSIFIRSGLQNLYVLLLRFLSVAGIVLVVSLLVAYALMTRLQGTITGPVTGLVRLMERISRDRDFSMRAAVKGPDELGSLANSFNEMLSAIQERDRELERQREDLKNSVADLRKSSDELQEANRKLEALDKLKSDFISIVSHELRTPLTSIKAFIELLIMKQGMPQEKKTRLLQTVNDESDRLGRLINDLLDLSKIEAGTMSWRFEYLSAAEIIQMSIDRLLPLSQKKGLRIITTLDPSLPQFFGDRDRLVQVVTNILSNAIKFTPEGGNITIKARQEAVPQPQLVVAISDTGAGIPSDEIERIFDKFHRSGDLLTNEVEGTGLGLSIARQIVESHGGKIWATSRKGDGSTFTFTIPLNLYKARAANTDQQLVRDPNFKS